MTSTVPIAAHDLTVNGIRMHIVVAGAGPDVLLLHGFPDSHAL
jgi:haloacetate dehalogenase